MSREPCLMTAYVCRDSRKATCVSLNPHGTGLSARAALQPFLVAFDAASTPVDISHIGVILVMRGVVCMCLPRLGRTS